jgi:hypothetical protein
MYEAVPRAPASREAEAEANLDRGDLTSHRPDRPSPQRRIPSTGRHYVGGRSPGDESHSLICEAVCSCRAFLTRASRSFPWGSFSASFLASSDC